MEVEAVPPVLDDLSSDVSYQEIIRAMQAAAMPYQLTLDDDTTTVLRNHTQELLGLRRREALEAYRDYTGTAERSLPLDEDALHDRLKGQNVIVTGGTGIIGSYLMRRLVDYEPARVVSISRGNMEPVLHVPGVEYQYADIRDSDAMNSIFKSVEPQTVFHVAAQKYPGRAEEEVKDTLAINVLGTKNVLQAARHADVEHVAYASTGKAVRPFSPDNYAASKKLAEQLLFEFADQDGITCSAARFTHVVDHSYLLGKLSSEAHSGKPIRLHNFETLLYVQSATESSQLLLNSMLDAQAGEFAVDSIRDLGMPVSLLDFALGVIATEEATDGALYFSGCDPGYEKFPYPGLYDPLTGGDVSPLLNALEAHTTDISKFCEEIDSYTYHAQPTEAVREAYAKLESALTDESESSDLSAILRLRDAASWAVWQSRLNTMPFNGLKRAVTLINKRVPSEIPEHVIIDTMIQEALASRASNQTVV